MKKKIKFGQREVVEPDSVGSGTLDFIGLWVTHVIKIVFFCRNPYTPVPHLSFSVSAFSLSHIRHVYYMVHLAPHHSASDNEPTRVRIGSGVCIFIGFKYVHSSFLYVYDYSHTFQSTTFLLLPFA